MLIIVSLSLLLATPTPADEAATYAAAGEAHLERAAIPGDHQLDEFDGAHKNFDSAYLVAEDPRYLCRALQVAEVVLARVAFTSDQERLSWAEVRQDDLDRLRQDAGKTRRANCRFDGASAPVQRRVALLTDADMPPPGAPLSATPESRGLKLSGPTRAPRRRDQAQMAVGATFTGLGLGFIGVMVGALSVQAQQAEAMRAIFDRARTAGELSDVDRGRADDLLADSIQTRHVAIGVGIAGAATLTTGITLLATRKLAARRFAVLPHGGPFGGGATVRLRF